MYSKARFKGVDVALRARDGVRRTRPDLQVIAFGIRPISRHLPLPAGSRYVRDPAQDRLRELYVACDVFLRSSRCEESGLPILEAMACRTPVVATRTGCAADVIDTGVEGHLAEVGDATGLAAGLRQVLDLPEPDWRRMSEAAFTRATAYTWDDAADLFEKALLVR